MEEQPILIDHLREIALDADGLWVIATDLMGRTYRLAPQSALDLAIWVAKHAQEVEGAQAQLDFLRRMEEAIAYGSLLELPSESSEHEPDPPPRKQRKRQQKNT